MSSEIISSEKKEKIEWKVRLVLKPELKEKLIKAAEDDGRSITKYLSRMIEDLYVR